MTLVVTVLTVCVSSSLTLIAEPGSKATPRAADAIALGSTPRSAHLLEPEAVAQAEDGAPETAASVRARLAELSEERPSLGGPIALLAVGAGLALGGLSFTLVGAIYVAIGNLSGVALGTIGTAFLIGGLIGIPIGITLVVIGAVTLGKRLRERKAINLEIQTLNRRLRELSAAPPWQQDAGPQPGLTVASF